MKFGLKGNCEILSNAPLIQKKTKTKKQKTKKTLSLEIDQEIPLMLAKKYAPNRANWVQKKKFPTQSPDAKGRCPLANPARGAAPWTPIVGQQFSPFPAAGFAPWASHRPYRITRKNYKISMVGLKPFWQSIE